MHAGPAAVTFTMRVGIVATLMIQGLDLASSNRIMITDSTVTSCGNSNTVSANVGIYYFQRVAAGTSSNCNPASATDSILQCAESNLSNLDAVNGTAKMAPGLTTIGGTSALAEFKFVAIPSWKSNVKLCYCNTGCDTVGANFIFAGNILLDGALDVIPRCILHSSAYVIPFV
jgi:hypothetical protein